MLNAQDLNSDTLVGTPGDLNGVSGLSLPRGNVSFRIQLCRGATNVALPSGSSVFFGLKGKDTTGPNSPKGDWLAMAQLNPIQAATGLYEAAPLALNTPEMIAATHADPADPTPEMIAFPAYGQLFYFLPGQTAPNFSQLIDVTVTAVLWTGVEGIAPSAMVAYPPAASLYAAIDKANAAEPGLGNPVHDGSVLSSTAAGARSWLVTTSAGVAAGRIVVLDGTGKLPALDGSQLTGITFAGGPLNPTTIDASGKITAVGGISIGNADDGGIDDSGTFYGNGSGLSSLPAAALVGIVPLGCLPAAVAGSLHHKGGWNAATNSPALASGGGTEPGAYYVVATSGSSAVDGVSVWTAGDWIVSDGTRWYKLDGAANPVSSVNGQQGAVTGAQAVAGANIAPNSVATGTINGAGALALAATGANNPITLTPTGTGVVAVAGGMTISGPLAVTGNITGPNLAPFHSVALAPTASGTGFTRLSGHDRAGVVSYHAFSAPTAGTTLGTVAFGTTYGNTPLPVVTLTPANADACSATYSGGARSTIDVTAVVAADGGSFSVQVQNDFPSSTTGTSPRWTYVVTP